MVLSWARHPPIGTVGLTEPEAYEQYGKEVKICTSSVILRGSRFLILFHFQTSRRSARSTSHRLRKITRSRQSTSSLSWAKRNALSEFISSDREVTKSCKVLP